jgi:hypothetical protein
MNSLEFLMVAITYGSGNPHEGNNTPHDKGGSCDFVKVATIL